MALSFFRLFELDPFLGFYHLLSLFGLFQMFTKQDRFSQTEQFLYSECALLQRIQQILPPILGISEHSEI